MTQQLIKLDKHRLMTSTLFILAAFSSITAPACNAFPTLAKIWNFFQVPPSPVEAAVSSAKKEMPPGILSVRQGDQAPLGGNSIWYGPKSGRWSGEIDEQRLSAAMYYGNVKGGVMKVSQLDARNCPNPEAGMQYLLGTALMNNPATQALTIKMVDLSDPEFKKDTRNGTYRVGDYDHYVNTSNPTNADRKVTGYSSLCLENLYRDIDALKSTPQYKAAAALGFTEIDIKKSGTSDTGDDRRYFHLYLTKKSNKPKTADSPIEVARREVRTPQTTPVYLETPNQIWNRVTFGSDKALKDRFYARVKELGAQEALPENKSKNALMILSHLSDQANNKLLAEFSTTKTE